MNILIPALYVPVICSDAGFSKRCPGFPAVCFEMFPNSECYYANANHRIWQNKIRKCNLPGIKQICEQQLTKANVARFIVILNSSVLLNFMALSNNFTMSLPYLAGEIV